MGDQNAEFAAIFAKVPKEYQDTFKRHFDLANQQMEAQEQTVIAHNPIEEHEEGPRPGSAVETGVVVAENIERGGGGRT